MSFSRRPLMLRPLLTCFAAAVVAAPLAAQTEGVPVVELKPPEAQPPVVQAEPAPAVPAEIQSPEPPPASDQPSISAPSPEPARARSNVGPSVADEMAASASLPPLPSGPAIAAPPATVPLPEGPVAVVPNASGTPIVVQPPVIEPPEVIDEPWTLGRAIPWLVAGLLIGGSLVVLFLQRRRRRIVTWRARSASERPAETGPLPTTVVELGPDQPPAAAAATPTGAVGPKVLVRKADRTSSTPERAEPHL